MRTYHQEPKFNSKELNKILPSYLLNEIENEEKREEYLKVEQESFDLQIEKESNTVRKKYLNIIFIFIYIGQK